MSSRAYDTQFEFEPLKVCTALVICMKSVLITIKSTSEETTIQLLGDGVIDNNPHFVSWHA